MSLPNVGAFTLSILWYYHGKVMEFCRNNFVATLIKYYVFVVVYRNRYCIILIRLLPLCLFPFDPKLFAYPIWVNLTSLHLAYFFPEGATKGKFKCKSLQTCFVLWPISVYCVVDEVRKGSFVLCRRKIKIKRIIWILTLVGGKKNKIVTFWYDGFMQFLFLCMSEEKKKEWNVKFLILMGHNFTTLEDLVDQTISLEWPYLLGSGCWVVRSSSLSLIAWAITWGATMWGWSVELYSRVKLTKFVSLPTICIAAVGILARS